MQPVVRQSTGQPSGRNEPTLRQSNAAGGLTVGAAHPYTRKTPQAEVRSRPEHSGFETVQHPIPQNTTAHPLHQQPPHTKSTAARELRNLQKNGVANDDALRHAPASTDSTVKSLSPVRQESIPPTATAAKSTIGQRIIAQTAQSETAAVHPASPSPLHRERAAEERNLQQTRVTDIASLTGHTSAGSKKPNAGQNKKKKQKDTELVVSDEGGNTVVSVVKAVIYMIFVVVISVFLAVAIIMVGNDVFAFVKVDTAIPVTIPEYASLNDIIDILYQNDVIEYPKVFRVYAQLKKDNGKFVAGDYTVSPVMNYDELLDEFKEKPKLGTVRITFPEGYTTDEIIDLMVSYGIGTREGYEDVIQNHDFDYWFLDELEENGISKDRFYRLDGYLFPDTYDFYNASSEVTVINKMLRRFDQLFTDEHRRLCAEMGYSVDDILSIASLIEKEAGSAAEFFNVSSVFHNRLKAKSYFPRLESDATIVYAIQHETGERPQLKNTDYESPYNTYLHEGLPPGPIANPSASAILAALSPAKTKYYYFVSDGSKTYFSETKEQHNQYIEAIRNNTIGQSYIPETTEWEQ